MATALAAAFLDGPWLAVDLAGRGSEAVDLPATRLLAVARQVVRAYREPPADRRRELVSYLLALTDFHALFDAEMPPVVSEHWMPKARAVHRRWPVPRLDTVDDLAYWAELSTSRLDWYADVRSLERGCAGRLRHYDRTWIYNRRGGVRLLERPRSSTKALQRRVVHEILDLVPAHDAAHGFVSHRSVRTYAQPHVASDVVIRLDVDGFFASITAGRVFGVFRTLGYPEAVAHVLAGLSTTVVPRSDLRAAPQALRDDDLGSRRRLLDRLAQPHLPQGSPTSPAIANLVAHRLDSRLSGLAKSMDATYTRYADDLALSLRGANAARRGRRLIDVVRVVVHEEGFRVNDAKTRLATAGQRQVLCGVVVNEAATVRRSERDELRALLHNCARHGPASQNRSEHSDFRAHVLGRIAWVSSVNPAHGERLRAQFDRIVW